jgi:hypothetical protein
MRIAEYSLNKLLQEIDQPRESGLSGSLEINTTALRAATTKMVMSGGGAFPETAERILSSMATEPTAEATARLRERGGEYARADIAARPECSFWHAITEHCLRDSLRKTSRGKCSKSSRDSSCFWRTRT